MPAQTLTLNDAMTRLRVLINRATTSLFTCSLTRRPLPSQAMSSSSMDPDGNIWFFTRACEAKKEEARHRAQLFYGNSGNTEYLSISGEGEVIADATLLESFEKKLLGDQSLFLSRDERMLICVHPSKAYSWDMRRGKMVPLLNAEDSPAQSIIA